MPQNCVVCNSKMNKMFDYHSFHYFRCPRCLHVTTQPYPTPAQIQEHYSEGFKEGNYNTVQEHNDVYASVMNKFVELIKKYFYKQGRSLNME